jgi:hypothetical protein
MIQWFVPNNHIKNSLVKTLVKEIGLNQRKLLSKHGSGNKKMWKLVALAPKIPSGHITSNATLNVQKGNLHWDCKKNKIKWTRIERV